MAKIKKVGIYYFCSFYSLKAQYRLPVFNTIVYLIGVQISYWKSEKYIIWFTVVMRIKIIILLNNVCYEEEA